MVEHVITLDQRDKMFRKMAEIPAHMLNPRVGIANTDMFGLTIVVCDMLSPPLVWHPKEHNWVEMTLKGSKGAAL